MGASVGSATDNNKKERVEFGALQAAGVAAPGSGNVKPRKQIASGSFDALLSSSKRR